MTREERGEPLKMAASRDKVLRTAVLSLACALSAARPIAAQQAAANPPSFVYEVVSIKPHNPTDNHGGFRTTDDTYSSVNMSLKALIVSAYHLKREEFVSGVSGPLADAHFDIVAKMDGETAAAFKKLSLPERSQQRAAMMLAMLEDRFKLKAHRETREATIFALVVAKSGCKLKPADPNDTYPNGMKGADGVGHAGMLQFGPEFIKFQALPLSTLAGLLQNQPVIHNLVLDKTGIAGKYDIDLHWFNEDLHKDDPTAAGPSLFAALEEQLGLKLENINAQVDTVVVDHVEKPSED